MQKSVILLLTLILAVFIITKPTSAQDIKQDDPLAGIDRLQFDKNYPAAITLCKNALKINLDEQTKLRTLITLGYLYTTVGEYDQATNIYEIALNMAKNLEAQKDKNSFWESYKNEETSIYFGIGHNSILKGDYKSALEAYSAAPGVASFCGNAYQQFGSELAFNIARCYEYLGEYDKAATIYLQTDNPRLLDLYESANQVEDLKKIINQNNLQTIPFNIKQYYFRTLPENKNQQPTQVQRPTTQLEILIGIRDLGEKKEWETLVQIMHKIEEQTSGAEMNSEKIAVIKAFALFPHETLPILKKELQTRPRGIIFEALGYNKTPEALSILKELLLKEDYPYFGKWQIHALTLMGKEGEDIIKELENMKDKLNIQASISIYKKDLPNLYIPLPSPPTKTKLPTNITIQTHNEEQNTE